MAADQDRFDTIYKRLRAQETDWNTPDELARTIQHTARFLESGQLFPPARILELGCGAGDAALWLAQHGYRTFGVDLSPVAIDWAREKFSVRKLPGDFRVASALDLSQFDDGFFDAVIDRRCFHCLLRDD